MTQERQATPEERAIISAKMDELLAQDEAQTEPAPC